MPIWQAWYAKHGIGYEVEFLVKILAATLKAQDWQNLRPTEARLYDNPYDMGTSEIDQMSAAAAVKMQGIMTTLANQFPQWVKPAKTRKKK